MAHQRACKSRLPHLFCFVVCYIFFVLPESRTNGTNVITPQVKLLKDTLDAWKKEVEKKPPTMSIEDAYDVLGLPKEQGQ